MGWSIAAGHRDDGASGMLVYLMVKANGVASAVYATHGADHESASAENIRKMHEVMEADDRVYFPR